MEEIKIKAELRKSTGKGTARKLRKTGKIPAVLYGKDIEPMPISVGERDWFNLSRHVRRNVILTMEIGDNGGVSTRPVMVKDVQSNVVGEGALHIDFLQVSMERTIEIEIPIVFTGKPKGLLKDGFIEQHMRSIMVECLPSQIPEAVEVDITNLDVGDSLHVSDISMPGIRLLEHPDVAIVTVTPPETEAAAPSEMEEETKEE